jgi:hypothetical protein
MRRKPIPFTGFQQR